MPTADIARAFGLGTPARELAHVARGAMGEVFRLDTERGPFAVKRLFWGSQGGEEENAEFQFAAADAGVPLARPLLTTNGDVLKRLADGWWRAYEWVDGYHVANDEPAPVDIACAVATSLGRLHSLKYEFGGPVDPWFLGVEAERVEESLARAASVSVNVAGARRALPALAAVSRLTPDTAAVGCHNDPDRSNAFVTSEGVVLIDWDNAGANLSVCEFAGALWQWGSAGNEIDVIPAMVRAYRETGAMFDPSGIEVFATLCSTWVNYALNCCDHVADPTTDEATLAFERPLIDQLAAYPVRVATLEHILELVPDE